MAKQEQIEMLSQGVEVWNRWRKENLKIKPYLIGASIVGAGLAGASLIGKPFLDAAVLGVGALNRSNLSESDLSEVDLSEVQLSEVDLSGVNLIKTNLIKANLRETNLTEAKLMFADLSGADLHEANLRGADLSGANLSGADLSCADLRGANLIEAVLENVNFENTNLTRADLSRANIRCANFLNADLSEANFTEADLTGTYLTGTKKNGANFTAAKFCVVEPIEVNISTMSNSNMKKMILNEENINRSMRIFLAYSYRTVDDEFVEGFKEVLISQGYEVLDGKADRIGSISQAILDKIFNSDMAVIVMTKRDKKENGKYTTTAWLLEEKGVALAFGKDVAMFVEEEIDESDIGGLQGDAQLFHFTRNNFLMKVMSFIKILKSRNEKSMA
ncbi:pentapeptide repeat-containing protein [Heliobacterium chlorum]|uniref:Pentapeptide repeat-containing protein n=1 Tax=Heliobacterium chlorum TaxID=2698 RepID=A0ABR7T1G4_HELCL|nr:pentapeptide repeat-containing protein [Heliobacterium chlorum]MBC9783476.1 pentapeptide repeat-containing protein [Heliobacterium chlorum]